MPNNWDALKAFIELLSPTKKSETPISETKIIKEVKKSNKDLNKKLDSHLRINIFIAFIFTILGYILGAWHPFR